MAHDRLLHHTASSAMTGLKISVLAPPKAQRMADIAVRELGARGHRVTVYASGAAFASDVAGRTATELILAMPAITVEPGYLEGAANLRALVSMVIGTDHFAIEDATERGLIVAYAHAEENDVSMAEATVMLMLASLYDFNTSQAMMSDPAAGALRNARMLSGKTVGLIGFGRIGQTVARLLAPWQVSLVAAIRHPRPLPEGVRELSLDALISCSDVIAVLVDLDASTRGLIDERRLRLMKEEVVLVNTARGPIIDEDALVRLLRERPRMRAALDVFAALPLAADHPLRRYPNVILTPHVVGHTRETTAALACAMVENVDCLSRGEPPLHVRNPAMIEGWRARWSPTT